MQAEERSPSTHELKQKLCPNFFYLIRIPACTWDSYKISSKYASFIVLYFEFFGNISVSNLLKLQLIVSGPLIVHKIEKPYYVCVVVEFCVFNF